MTPLEQSMADAHDVTKRELKVLKKSSDCTIRLQRVTMAALKLDRARLRSEWANCEMSMYDAQLQVKKWESRTGLNMSDVLDGTYGHPWSKS